MFYYEIINTPSFKINKKLLDLIFNNIDNIVQKKQNGTVNIIFLDSYSIKNYNNKYRGINSETDVLSFHYFDNFDKINSSEIVGEILISEEKIIEQGIEFLHGTEKEFYKILIHSLLHILGFDHEDEKDYLIMEKLENQVWTSIFG